MSGKLDRALIYLSGAMEFAPDHGIEWRRKFIARSNEVGLRIDYIDPTDKVGARDLNVVEDKKYQAMLRNEGRFEELRDFVGRYRRYDLRACDYMDALVACVDPEIPHWGTPNEIYVAETAHKPRFLIVPGGKYNTPYWLFDVFPLENIFDNPEECIQRLLDLNSGKQELSDEWVLIRKYFV